MLGVTGPRPRHFFGLLRRVKWRRLASRVRSPTYYGKPIGPLPSSAFGGLRGMRAGDVLERQMVHSVVFRIGDKQPCFHKDRVIGIANLVLTAVIHAHHDREERS